MSCAINKGGFFEIAFVVVVDTHLPRFEALAYVLPHFDALTHVVIRVSSAFIFQTFAEVCYSVFVNRSSFKSVLNLRKAYIFWVCWRSTIDLCLMNLPKRSSFKRWISKRPRCSLKIKKICFSPKVSIHLCRPKSDLALPGAIRAQFRPKKINQKAIPAHAWDQISPS